MKDDAAGSAGVSPARSDAHARTSSAARGWHARFYLPHYDGGAIAQFVTFRLADSLPRERLDAWHDELAHLSEAKAAREKRRRAEAYLDAGRGNCWLRDERVAGCVQRALLHFHPERYGVHAWVIMPNHVHVLFTPTSNTNLGQIVQSWKSYTAKEANRLLGRSGMFWQVDYFDRAIRDERHYRAVRIYIESNPTRAGLCVYDHGWRWSSVTHAANVDDGGTYPGSAGVSVSEII